MCDASRSKGQTLSTYRGDVNLNLWLIPAFNLGGFQQGPYAAREPAKVRRVAPQSCLRSSAKHVFIPQGLRS